MLVEFGARLNDIFAAAPRNIELLPFSPELTLDATHIGDIEIAYYSRDIWEGTEKSALSPAAQAFWRIIERAQNLQWMAVYSAGMDIQR